MTFTIDVPHFQKEMDKLSKQYGISVLDLMKDTMRLLLLDLIKRTPPRTYSQGRKSIGKDIAKIFWPIKTKRILKQMAKSMANDYPSDHFNVDGDMGRMAALHASNRSSRGRVRRFLPKEQRQYVPMAAYKRFRTHLQKRAGTLKAGWLPAAEAFGAKSPAWIRRNQKRHGRFKLSMNKKGTGYLLAVNSVRFSPPVLTRITKAALKRRERDLTKGIHLRINKLAQIKATA